MLPLYSTTPSRTKYAKKYATDPPHLLHWRANQRVVNERSMLLSPEAASKPYSVLSFPCVLSPPKLPACAERCMAKMSSCAWTSCSAARAQDVAVRCNTNVCLAARAAVKGPRLRVGIDGRHPSGAAVLTTLGQSRWDASIIMMNEPTRAAANKPASEQRDT